MTRLKVRAAQTSQSLQEYPPRAHHPRGTATHPGGNGRTHPAVRPSPTQGACFPVTVNVDLPDHICTRCTVLGDGVLYAVKTLARQLADDPRLVLDSSKDVHIFVRRPPGTGSPSGLPLGHFHLQVKRWHLRRGPGRGRRRSPPQVMRARARRRPLRRVFRPGRSAVRPSSVRCGRPRSRLAAETGVCR